MQPVLIGIGAYLVVQFAVGMLVSRRIASESDYLLAGRRLGVTLAAFSIFATWFGAETVVGAAGSIYSDGLVGRLRRPLRLRLLLDRARRRRRRAAVAAPVHDVRRSVPRALFAGRRAPRRAADGADVGALGRGADSRVRPSRQRRRPISKCRSRSRLAAGFVVVYTVAGGLLADVVHRLRAEHRHRRRARGAARRRRQRARRHRRARRVDRRRAPRAVLDGRRDAARDHRSVGRSGVRLAAGRRDAVADHGLQDRGDCAQRDAARRSHLPHGRPHSRDARARGARSRAGARRAGAARRVARRAAPVDVPVRAVRRRADLGDPLHRRQLLAGRELARLAQPHRAAEADADGSPENSCGTQSESPRSASLAYVIALYAGGIYELVATASAFGSAGIFVVGLFGLFSRVGGAPSAYAALVAGIVVWAAGEYWLDWSTPYVAALAAALAAYLLAAVVVRRAPIEAHGAERGF